jgi:NitT/TauT family transport system substrate-binding protein
MISRRAFVHTSAGLVSALVGSNRSAFAATSELQTVRVASTPDDTFVAVVWAQRTGMFKAAGLDVQLSPQSTSGAAIAAGVIGGAFDIGKSSLTSILIAHLKNIPLILIAPGTLYDARNPYGLLIVSRDSTAKTGKDLNGQTLSVASLNGLDQVGINAWVDRTGGDSKSLKFVELPESEAGPAMAQHRTAGSFVIRPQLDEALASGQARVLAPAYDQIAPLFILSAWFATGDFVAKHPDVVQTFARVLVQSATYGNAHHAETAPLLAEVAKIPIDVIEKQPRGILGTQLTPALVQPVIDLSAKYGMLARSFPADEVIYKAPGR